MPVSRRRFLKTSAATTVLIAGKSLLGPVPMRGKPSGGALGIPQRLSGPTLTAASGSAQIFEGGPTDLYTLNGLYPGPTIELDRGDELLVRMENRLPDQDLILHWHGILAPSSMDGHPHQAVPSGEDYDYRYTVEQRAATC